ncbi:DUF2249 domain-containing protein [Halomicrobium sp. IBSBa]|uniref:DUF2249 domain-containing protein n=1 Tax=Halomicrobium mukohataei TaxID=57705 RepID=A0A847U3R4_9EURY|nr:MULTISPECIES: DUF2249 domain-containing protein [Halomicrobium]MBO4248433.1 DUF2249 domain-containing protein [Halomicrobium sp. IBSBa]NLV10313.1 DUF2249 domain-containing protein [Halomicrobium mukohataei]
MAHEYQTDADRRLDAREIDGEPFADIMNAIESLPADETLLLVNSFEPVPLYDVLEERGFEYTPHNPSSDLWEIEITPA